MNLEKECKEKVKREFAVQEELYRCIDGEQSLLFNAGAGSGKTYALKECLKYIINKYGKELEYHNQNVVCITYTNVAAEEIKERLGNSSKVLVSTIHERIWELIRRHQNELVAIHIEKLAMKIKKLEDDMNAKREFEKYRKLSEKEKCTFREIILSHKDVYYESYGGVKEKIQSAYKPYLGDFFYLTDKIGNFKEITKTIIAMDNYITCLGKIKFKEKHYSMVKYDAMHNSDRLYKMRISHDTLLEYGLEMISKYDLLKQMIIDKYPYFFIDEYQDTDERVIRIMNDLQVYAEKIGHSFFVGYYGDSVQNIYQEGVGDKINLLHHNLKKIDKEFNRRSTQEVIDIANNIRNDSISQASIYEDCYGGSVKFYKGNPERIEEFINKYKHVWKATKDNPIHCFILRNKTVAKYSRFENIYNLFGQTQVYSGANYEQLNTELLSKEVSKLGEIPSFLFNILEFYFGIQNETGLLKDILPVSIWEKMNVERLKVLTEDLKRLHGETLKELVESATELYNKDKDGYVKAVLKAPFDLNDISLEIFRVFLLERLFPRIDESITEKANDVIDQLLNVSIEEYRMWYRYVLDEEEGSIHYHTYHGTKGLEFDNVLIIMENEFGNKGDKSFFNYYFSNIGQYESGISNIDKFNKAKNLLYVSVTRAIQNLRILYIDDVSTFESGINKIFGKAFSFLSESENDV